jgi:hypothetical protein
MTSPASQEVQETGYVFRFWAEIRFNRSNGCCKNTFDANHDDRDYFNAKIYFHQFSRMRCSQEHFYGKGDNISV